MGSRKDYEETVRHPGKFEGEQAYVPYLWDRMLDGGDGFGDVCEFGLWAGHCEITCNDNDIIKLFPELKVGQVIYLCENGQGFVSEMSKEEYDNTEKAYDQFMESTKEEV